MRICLTGAGGFVGSRLAEAWAGRHELFGTGRQGDSAFPGEHAGVDLAEEPARLADRLEAWRPDAVIHCAAVSQPVRFSQEPARCRRVNVEAAHHVAAWCRKRDALLIAFSSDTVYGDAADPATPAPAGGWREDSPLSPVHSYGASKVQMEQAILERLPGALLLRSSLLWGRAKPGQNSFSQWLLRRLQEDPPVPVFQDNRRALLCVGALPDILDGLLTTLWDGGEAATGLAGPLNLGGADYLSREEFARLLWARLGLDPSLLRPLATAEAGLSEPLAKELPLDLARLRARLGHLPTTEEFLAKEHS